MTNLEKDNILKIDSKVPKGPLADKWTNYKST